MTNSSGLRVGDAERELAAERLGKHFVAGRLSEVEYQERLGSAFGARTGADLTPLFADLPVLDEQRPLPARVDQRQHRTRVGVLLVAALVATMALVGHGAASWAFAMARVHGQAAAGSHAQALAAHGPGLPDPVLLVVMTLLALVVVRRVVRRGWHSHRPS